MSRQARPRYLGCHHEARVLKAVNWALRPSASSALVESVLDAQLFERAVQLFC